jgi:hypothetical protein
MRHSSRLLLSIILFASITPAALSQKRFCPKPLASPFKHDGQIVTSFDGRAGGMRTTLEHPRPLGRGSDLFYLGATFINQDPRRALRPTLDLVLFSASPVARLGAGGALVFVCDGQARVVNRNVSYRSQSDGRGAVVESAKVTLTYADATAITQARKVTARVGTTEIEFTNNHLEALRELVSQMAPSPGRWGTDDRLSAR